MKTATIRARIEPDLKKKAEKILSEIGLSTSSAIILFYRQLVARHALPFPLHVPNAETRKALSESLKGAKHFKTVDELFEDLNS